MGSLQQDEAYGLCSSLCGGGVDVFLKSVSETISACDEVADLSMEGVARGEGELSLLVVGNEDVKGVLETGDHGFVLGALHDAP